MHAPNRSTSSHSKRFLETDGAYGHHFHAEYFLKIHLQTCHNSGLTGIYPGDGKKIPVSGQLGQNSGELPFTRNFLAARFYFFFFTILSNIFFLVKFPYAVSNILSISIATL